MGRTSVFFFCLPSVETLCTELYIYFYPNFFVYVTLFTHLLTEDEYLVLF